MEILLPLQSLTTIDNRKEQGAIWLPALLTLQKINVFISRGSADIAYSRQLTQVEVLILERGVVS